MKRLIHCAVLVTTALCLSDAFAQAQSGSNNEQSGKSVTEAVGLRFFDPLALRRPARRAAFALMAPHGYATASEPSFHINLLAAGPNLPVLGGGTLGRLTKWTGFTSSNSLIGDSTIFESKTGLVGIGTDSPTSRLTVAGPIRSLSGGFQFPDGSLQTTAAVGSLFTVAHDTTLIGDGTQGSPLGVAVPLILTGSVDIGSGIVHLTNNSENGVAVLANGGPAGDGVKAQGGTGGSGGDGVEATGGDGDILTGGNGVLARGGVGKSTFPGGHGIEARGGISLSGRGGVGVFASGGSGQGGDGGEGVRAFGGTGHGAGNTGGIGIEVFNGTGLDGAGDGLAGKFNGDVEVAGTLAKGGGSFKIDHPLDPENKYLYHSFVESPDMKNIYDGTVVTDEKGEASITLPDYFERLNRDFRYQLTVIGTFAQAIVSGKIKGNSFTIKTSVPAVEVSWQVTGIRRDAWANKNRIKVEEAKSEKERGYYLHPEAYEQPEERGVEWARHPELMRQMKQRRIEAEQKHKPNHR